MQFFTHSRNKSFKVYTRLDIESLLLHNMQLLCERLLIIRHVLLIIVISLLILDWMCQWSDRTLLKLVVEFTKHLWSATYQQVGAIVMNLLLLCCFEMNIYLLWTVDCVFLFHLILPIFLFEFRLPYWVVNMNSAIVVVRNRVMRSFVICFVGGLSVGHQPWRLSTHQQVLLQLLKTKLILTLNARL